MTTETTPISQPGFLVAYVLKAELEGSAVNGRVSAERSRLRMSPLPEEPGAARQAWSALVSGLQTSAKAGVNATAQTAVSFVTLGLYDDVMVWKPTGEELAHGTYEIANVSFRVGEEIALGLVTGGRRRGARSGTSGRWARPYITSTRRGMRRRSPVVRRTRPRTG